MPESLFQTLFARTPLYFSTQDQTAFIADTRWYPRSQIVSAAARGLVEGPSQWLAGSATSLLPPGTQLANPVVILNGSLARVDLTSDVAELPERVRNILYAQFIKTLTGVSGVTAVEILANGAPLASQNETELPTYPYTTSSLMILSDGKPAIVNDNGISLIGNANELKNLNISGLATPYGQPLTRFVAIGDEASTLYEIDSTGRYTALVSGTDFVGPSMDIKGYAWVSQRVPDMTMIVANINSGVSSVVDVPWLAGMNVHEIAVSREGSRIAMIVDDDGILQILVAGIVRDSSGRPLALGEPIRIGQRLADISDMAWIADTRLVVIGKGQNMSANALYSVPLGENISIMASLDNIVNVTAGRGEESILLNTSNGDVYVYDAGGWRKVLEDATLPTLPG